MSESMRCNTTLGSDTCFFFFFLLRILFTIHVCEDIQVLLKDTCFTRFPFIMFCMPLAERDHF